MVNAYKKKTAGLSGHLPVITYQVDYIPNTVTLCNFHILLKSEPKFLLRLGCNFMIQCFEPKPSFKESFPLADTLSHSHTPRCCWLIFLNATVTKTNQTGEEGLEQTSFPVKGWQCDRCGSTTANFL